MTVQANFLVEDIDCEQSLFSSKVRAEQRKEEQNTSVELIGSACKHDMQSRKPHELLMTRSVSPLVATCMSHSQSQLDFQAKGKLIAIH